MPRSAIGGPPGLCYAIKVLGLYYRMKGAAETRGVAESRCLLPFFERFVRVTAVNPTGNE